MREALSTISFVAGMLVLTYTPGSTVGGGEGGSENPLLGEWCDTHRVWAEKAKALGVLRGDGCPTNGNCDDPLIRDLYIPDVLTPIKTVRVHFIILRDDAGGNPAATVDDIAAQVDQMNADYGPYGFVFVFTYRFVNSSRYRYLTGDEIDGMKEAFAVGADTKCNIYVTDLPDQLAGRGTFPWDQDALTNLGGIIIDEAVFGAGQDVLVHEMGHNLGLWHTQHGVDDELDSDPDTMLPCGDPCRDQAGAQVGDTTGDFCSDTPPTPLNDTCADPGGTDPCSDAPWGQTQPENYMSYGGPGCWSLFAEDQSGRMYCWTEAELASWVKAPGDELAKLFVSEARCSDSEYFGHSVAISGETVVVGAWGRSQSCPYPYCGAALIFRFDGSRWVQEAELAASDAEKQDYFGYSVAVSGDTIVIGAPDNDDACPSLPYCNSGSAYIFRYDTSTWVEEAILRASDATAFDRFGRSVAISRNTVLVGAYGDDDGGSAYVFRYNGSDWTQEAKLLPSDGSVCGEFGWSVGISGDTTVVGAPEHTGSGPGSAYVFRYGGSTWTQEAKLLPSDGTRLDFFGSSVAVSGNTTVIGAPSVHYADPPRSGSAYVFRLNGPEWVEEAKLVPSDGATGDYFGISVAVSGETVVVGAYQDDDNGDRSGSVYLFHFDSSAWVEKAKLLPSDGGERDFFGASVALDGGMTVIGAYGDDDAYSWHQWDGYSGAAYVFAVGVCNPYYPSDLDWDGAVDLDDYAAFQFWMQGPGDLPAAGCQPGDADADGDTDLTDFRAFQLAFTGSQ